MDKINTSMVIHIATEAVLFGGAFYYMHRKYSELKEEMNAIIENQEKIKEIVYQHHNVLVQAGALTAPQRRSQPAQPKQQEHVTYPVEEEPEIEEEMIEPDVEEEVDKELAAIEAEGEPVIKHVKKNKGKKKREKKQ